MARLDFANLTRFRAELTAPILDHCAWPAPCADDQACVRVGSCTESDAIDQWVPSLHTSWNWLVCAVPPTVGRGCPGLRVSPIRRTANNKLEGPALVKVTRTLTQKKVGCRPESPMRRGSCISMPLRCIQYRRRASRLLKAVQNGLWLAELRMQSPSHAGG